MKAKKVAQTELARALARRASDPNLSEAEREAALQELRSLAAGTAGARGAAESRLVTGETR